MNENKQEKGKRPDMVPDTTIERAQQSARELGTRWLEESGVELSTDTGNKVVFFLEEVARVIAEKGDRLFDREMLTLLAEELVAPHLANERRELNHRATKDKLTGLANVGQFELARESAEKDPNQAIVFIDANNFGDINKTISDDAGDEAIKLIADHLKRVCERVLGTSERLFRKGGDEFIIIAPKDLAGVLRQEIISTYGMDDEDELPPYASEAGQYSKKDRQHIGYVKYGNIVTSLGVGVGNTKDEADADMKESKKDLKSQIRKRQLGLKVLRRFSKVQKVSR